MASTYSFSVPPRSSLDDFLHETRLECKKNGTSFSAWICSSIDPNIAEENEALRKQIRFLLAGWIYSTRRGNAIDEMIMDFVPHWLPNADARKLLGELRQELATLDAQFSPALLDEEAAKPPTEIVMTVAPEGGAR